MQLTETVRLKLNVKPCQFYVCAHEECKKGRKDVTMATCQTCNKYRPRKVAVKKASVTDKKNKAILKDIKKYQKEI